MITKHAHQRRGFTLLESLVAAMLLSGGVVALCSVSTTSLARLGLNRTYETAWQVLDRQMTMVGYLGLENVMDQGETEGVVRLGDCDYYWQLTAQPQASASMNLVRMTVRWQYRNHPYTINASTLIHSTPTVAQPTQTDQG